MQTRIRCDLPPEASSLFATSNDCRAQKSYPAVLMLTTALTDPHSSIATRVLPDRGYERTQDLTNCSRLDSVRTAAARTRLLLLRPFRC
jgi:hypothetical protein